MRFLGARPFLAFATWAMAAFAGHAVAADDATVVLVCEHGSVKSLIAASLFNAAASERGLPFHAVARGITPDASVPPPIADALAREGVDVREFKPTAISKDEAVHASRVVTIGVDLPANAVSAPNAVERWDDVPAASVDYAAARASLKRHVDELLNQLQAPARSGTTGGAARRRSDIPPVHE